MRHAANRLWRDDLAYAERRYRLRTTGQRSCGGRLWAVKAPTAARTDRGGQTRRDNHQPPTTNHLRRTVTC